MYLPLFNRDRIQSCIYWSKVKLFPISPLLSVVLFLPQTHSSSNTKHRTHNFRTNYRSTLNSKAHPVHKPYIASPKLRRLTSRHRNCTTKHGCHLGRPKQRPSNQTRNQYILLVFCSSSHLFISAFPSRR